MNTEKVIEESPESAPKKYKELISKLKFQTTPSGSFHLYEGFWHPSSFLEGLMYLQDNFCAKPTDIFLSSTMKSGTTWLKSLVFAIVTRTKFNISSKQLLTTTPHSCVPNIEFDLLPNSLFEKDPELPLLGTHIPYTSLPRSIIASDCKIIYIYREPKDVFISLWHFWSKLMRKPLDLHTCFELFLKGIGPYGPFWDHVLSYWEASLERPGKILVLKYEDLMKDTILYTKKMAGFVDLPFSIEEEKEGVMEKLVDLCSFENLSNLDVNKTGKLHVNRLFAVDNVNFFRKGQTEDWKNYLTPEMAEKLDSITEEKFGSRGLMVPSKTHH